MDEFSLINAFFKSIAESREDVLVGIGDDGACVSVPPDKHLVISTDTLLADVHFPAQWDAYDIAYRSLMTNISDIAAMGAIPTWVTLALTLPEINSVWLNRFSQGLQKALKDYHIILIGGDTTRGPLSITFTIHGLVAKHRAICRSGANVGDKIYVSGELGGAALAVAMLAGEKIAEADTATLLAKLFCPVPRIDLVPILQEVATAAIDISDGLSADLNHICTASGLGACISSEAIPVHPGASQYRHGSALDLALNGGDDYELCFTVSPENASKLMTYAHQQQLKLYLIGEMEEKSGLRMRLDSGNCVNLPPKGYTHF